MAGRGYTRSDGVVVSASRKWSGSGSKSSTKSVSKGSGKSKLISAAAKVVAKVGKADIAVTRSAYLGAVRQAKSASWDAVTDRQIAPFLGQKRPGVSGIRIAGRNHLMFRNGKVVSMVTLDSRPLKGGKKGRDVEEVAIMATPKAHRGKGYATQLLDNARKKGYQFPPSAFDDSTSYTKTGRKFMRSYVKSRAHELATESGLSATGKVRIEWEHGLFAAPGSARRNAW